MTKWYNAIQFSKKITNPKKQQYALAFVNWKFSGQGNKEPLPEEGIAPDAAKKIRQAVEKILKEG